MIAYKIKEVHKSDIKPGNTILCTDGNLRTVCKKDIKRNKFTGITIFGNCYKLGCEPVKKALIEKVGISDLLER